MIDSGAAKSRFENVMQVPTYVSRRTQLLRVTEFLEALVESESRSLVREYAPRLIVRIARLAQSMLHDEIFPGIADRLVPLLWSVAMTYPDLDVKSICLGLVQTLKNDTSKDAILCKAC